MPSPLCPSDRRRRLVSGGLMLVLACAVGVAASSCSDDDSTPAGALAGERPGTERYVVYLKGEGPDLAAYRKARADGKDTKAIEDELRAAARKRVKPLRKELKAVGATVVEVWYLTNAITVEVSPGNVATLKGLEGVDRVEPDQLYP